MHRTTVLATAAKLTAEDRNKTHGDAVEQHTLQGVLVKAYLEAVGDKYPMSHNIAIIQVLCKISRVAKGRPGNTDNYIDGAAYLAIAAECLPEYGSEDLAKDHPDEEPVTSTMTKPAKGKKK